MKAAAPAGQGAAARGLAAQALARVLDEGVTLDAALAGIGRESVSAGDQAQAKALAYGAVRWHLRHRLVLKRLVARPLGETEPLVEALLSVGLFQLLDDRQPAYAAVSATVEAARWLQRPRAAGFVNATLRRFQRERAGLMADVMASEEGRSSHPPWLIRRIAADWPAQSASVLAANQAQPPLWLRVNAMKTTPAQYAAQLRADTGVEASPLAGFPVALRLAQPLPVARLSGFPEGLVSVQDAASQLAAAVLAPAPGSRVLDACAAPGGKATHLLEHAGGNLDLVALDEDPVRMLRVRENLQRLGLRAATPVGDARLADTWWNGKPFDCILLDAPCSGTGVIRRHPDIKLLRRETDIPALAARQGELLDRLWPLLKPGGRLVYATCSVLKAENHEVVAGFLGRRPDAAPVAPGTVPDFAQPGGHGDFQLLPGAADTDGLYYALMMRRSA
jgi:16S rRNA (cytosine967-C5)-methyltransferase